MLSVLFFAFAGYTFAVFFLHCSRFLGEKDNKHLQLAIFSLSTPYKQNLLPVFGGHGKFINYHKFYRGFISLGLHNHRDPRGPVGWAECIFPKEYCTSCLEAELVVAGKSGGEKKDWTEDLPSPCVWGVLQTRGFTAYALNHYWPTQGGKEASTCSKSSTACQFSTTPDTQELDMHLCCWRNSHSLTWVREENNKSSPWTWQLERLDYMDHTEAELMEKQTRDLMKM